MPDLLFEIGTEEIPAGYIDPALDFLRVEMKKLLDDARLAHGDIDVDGTPRRLVVIVRDVADGQADKEEEVTGPKAEIAWGPDGALSKAGQGFLRGRGIDEKDAYKKETGKGVVIAAMVREAGQPAAQVLPARLEALVGAIPFKKTMRWSDDKATFARPIRWMLCLLGSEALSVRYADVKSGASTCGHRFHAPTPVEVSSVAEYREALAKGRVTLSRALRRAAILEGAHAVAKEAGGKLLEDDALLDIVTNLVETPWPVLGRFNAHFLDIPKEILLSEMREHQKYFAVVKDDGSLLPAFVVIAGSEPVDAADVAAGNARVLRSRFEDGAFYYREDIKRSLESFAERLDHVRFQRELGSIGDKVRRIEALAATLADALGADGTVRAHSLRAARLCKADLVSGVVSEFPELQGTMGRYYAKNSGEPDAVANAIEEHYLPRSASDALPPSLAGAVVALADRLDTLVGILGVGKAPTGSADPFGLRRAAIAILNILIGRGAHASLSSLVAAAASGVAPHITVEKAALEAQVLEFLKVRMKGVLVDHASGLGIAGASDIVDAVIGAGFDDVADAAARTVALARLRASQAENFLALAATFKRVGNILEKARSEGLDTTQPLNAAVLEADAEKALAERAASARSAFEGLGAAHPEGYARALDAIVELKPSVDKFFDDVLVMVDDENLKAARLSLLAGIESLLTKVADFTRIQIEG